MYASELKEVLLRLRPDFNEKAYGCATFYKLLSRLANRFGDLKVQNDNYNVIVSLNTSGENNEVIPVSCEMESELSLLTPEERKEFLEGMNVTESVLTKVIKATYKLLNLSTFFTVGADECRAWTFKNNMSAPQCAGVIHTDFERGFICAEVYTYDAIHELGSEAAVKERGKLRTDGKGYYPKDGDIMFFRFNVTK